MSGESTAKERAVRVPLDYLRRRDPLERWKLWLTLAALAAAVIYAASGWGRGGQLRYSPGRLATAHATWDERCEACHVPYRRMRDGSWFSSPDAPAEERDARCKTCHKAPQHHATEDPAEIHACASCHMEHHGRDAQLTHVSDHQCVRCHENLTEHSTRKSEFFNRVTAFPTDHPPFQVAEPDPGRLEFKHKLHMSPGLVAKDQRKQCTFRDIQNAEHRERLRAQQQREGAPAPADDAPVQLECRSCHVLDANDLGALALDHNPSLSAPRHTTGEYMLPIQFEIHCRACHPLAIESLTPGECIEVPHGLQPAELHGFLGGFAIDALAPTKRDAAKDGQSKPRPTLGELIGKMTPEEEAMLRERVQNAVAAAEKELYLHDKHCAKCHAYNMGGGKINQMDIRVGESPQFKTQPTNIKQVWFEHARFDHSAHRALDCRECHDRAFHDSRDKKGPSKVNDDVLLPRIETCAKCHSPALDSDDGTLRGARFDCSECHRYHGGDSPAHARGALTRGALDRRDIHAFLTGAPGER